MEALIIIVVLLALGFWHADRKKAADAAQVRVREAAFDAEVARNLEEQEQVDADLISFVSQHERTLLMKERQLTFTDDYGQVDQSAFVKNLSISSSALSRLIYSSGSWFATTDTPR